MRSYSFPMPAELWIPIGIHELKDLTSLMLVKVTGWNFEGNFSKARLSIPENLMVFNRLLSRIFESKFENSYTWRDREKKKILNLSKQTQTLIYSNVSLFKNISPKFKREYVLWVLKISYLNVFGEQGWSWVLEWLLFSFEVLKVKNSREFAEKLSC